MALTDTIQCDGVTTAFTLTRAVTTKESLSLTIASGDDAGLVVSPSDYTFSPVNSVSQSVTITWANAVNYGTVGTPVDVTVAIYHNPGADPADTLLYSYDSASAMRPEMVGRDLEHVIDLVKMVIGGADLATTSLGDQEDAIAAAVAVNVTQTADIAALDVRVTASETDIDALQAEDLALRALLVSAVAGTASTAADVVLADAGGYFTGINVETAMQELGPVIPAITDAVAIAALTNAGTKFLRNVANVWGLFPAPSTSYEDYVLSFAGSDYQEATLNNASGTNNEDTRRYTGFSIVTAGCDDITLLRYIGAAGSPGFGPTKIRGYKSTAGALAVTVRCFYEIYWYNP